MNAYRNLWSCRKVCDFLPKVMVRGWGSLIIQQEQKIFERKCNKFLNSGRFKNIYCRGQQLANLYGGAIVIRFIQDGRDYNEPVSKHFHSNQRQYNTDLVQYSRIYNPWEVYPYLQNGYEDVENPEYYQVSIAGTDSKLGNYVVHKDRILRFRGAPTDYETMRLNRGFEDSLLTPFLSSALRYLSALNYVGASVTSFEFIVHKLQNLFSELENVESQAHLKERLRVAHQTVSSLRGLILDKEEEDVQIVTRNYSGVKDILEVLLNEVIAASGLTKPQFIQEHPSGLSSTGESERLAEADVVRALQIEKWGDSIEWDCQLQLWAQGYYGDDWNWEWTNLFQLTPLEEAELTLKLAQAQQLSQPSSFSQPL